MADSSLTEATTEGTATVEVRREVLLSPSALKRLRKLIAEENKPDLMLRLTVEGGGCSGFQYSFALDTKAGDDDQVFQHEDVAVVTDEASLELVAGCTVDWVENPGAAYFSINNPNATSSCGCGMSFAI